MTSHDKLLYHYLICAVRGSDSAWITYEIHRELFLRKCDLKNYVFGVTGVVSVPRVFGTTGVVGAADVVGSAVGIPCCGEGRRPTIVFASGGLATVGCVLWPLIQVPSVINLSVILDRLQVVEFGAIGGSCAPPAISST